MDMNDYPSLSKTQPFGRDNNQNNPGILVFTRGSLKRVSGRAFTIAAAFAGAAYIFNAIDSLINGNDIKSGNNNNNKYNKNGKY